MARTRASSKAEKTEDTTKLKNVRKVTLKAKKSEKTKKLKNKKKQAVTKNVKEIVSKFDSSTLTIKLIDQYSKQFQEGLEALLLYEEQNKSNDLFKREKPIFLQIDSIKIPKCPKRNIRIQLTHTLLTDKNEVCLIVPDLKRGRNFERTIEHYEELFRSKNITSIKRILPLRQLKTEYDQYELKRRLCGYYDFFLAAGKIAGHVQSLLGKTFYVKRKFPVPIKLKESTIDETIEDALRKTVLHLHPNGTSFIVQFGHSEMSIDQLSENLHKVALKLFNSFPGKWNNIRSLHIRTDKSISIPIYYTLKNPNKVPVPVIKPIRPKKFVKVTDELSTLGRRHNKVTVHPGGRIELQNQANTNNLTERQQRRAKAKAKAKRKRDKKFEMLGKKYNVAYLFADHSKKGKKNKQKQKSKQSQL